MRNSGMYFKGVTAGIEVILNGNIYRSAKSNHFW